MTPLDAALDYAVRGLPVFPCRATSDKAAGSKAPHLPGESAPGKRDGGHWLASTDPARLRDWWRRWPDALVGVPTGRRSGSVVIDLDPREHPAGAMLDALRAFCGGALRAEDRETGEIREPAVSRTQSGGLHLYFAWPRPSEMAATVAALSRRGQSFQGSIGNRTNLFRAFLAAGEAEPALGHIDVRGEGGYVIAPPSVMSSGAAYEWLVPPQGEHGLGPIAPLPAALRAVITGESGPAAERWRAAPQPRFTAGPASDERVRRYIERSVRGALATAAAAAEGNRNAAVFWAACRLGEFVRGGVLGRGEAETLLLAHLPTGIAAGDRQFLGTIRSGLDNASSPAFSPARLSGGGRPA